VRWLLDTNVISENVRKKPSPKVLDWIATRSSGETAISIVTLAELRDGALCVSDEAKRRQLTAWIDTEIADYFYDRTLPLTVDILLDWIGLARTLRLKGRTRDPTDLLIAATARVHDLILVSHNVRHFAGTGIVIYDPWNDQTHQTEI
jgi:toxin FitB